jgi:AcrR family transcriptional regulator
MQAAVAQTPIRDRKARETRARIAEAGLELFVSQGFAATTIDQIAAAANVGRRTVFRHFPSKETILFDHLVVQRDAALQMLRDRPPGEPPLVGLHAVLREQCKQGYDRRALSQIGAVLASNPRIAGQEFTGTLRFKFDVLATLDERLDEWSASEIYGLVLMAFGWFEAATSIYFKERNRSLVECFDEIVATCRRSIATDLT